MAVKVRQEWTTPEGERYFGDEPPAGSKQRAFWLFVDWKGQRVKRRIGSKEAADHGRIMVEAKLKLGKEALDALLPETKPEANQPVEQRFSDYFKTWLDTYAKLACKTSTWKSYERDFRLYLEPALGDHKLGEITRDEVKQLLYTLLNTERPIDQDSTTSTRGKLRKRRIGRGTVKNSLAALRACLTHAVEEGKLAFHPALRLGRFLQSKDEPQGSKVDFLNAEELSQLLATCRESRPYYFPFVLTLARTGLRLGEAVALKWGDIDFNGRFIMVARNFTGGRLTTPKSGKGRRVDMSAGLSEVLGRELLGAREKALAAGRAELRDWVFVDPRGSRLDGGNFRSRVWGGLLLKAGLRRIRIHDLRHTYASLLIQDGWPLKYIQEQLGHSSISITSDVYGHLVPGANRAAADRLDALAPAIQPAPIRTPDAPNLDEHDEQEEKLANIRGKMVAPGLEPGTSCM
jgi:integrase